jgi:hypothetical protein
MLLRESLVPYQESQTASLSVYRPALFSGQANAGQTRPSLRQQPTARRTDDGRTPLRPLVKIFERIEEISLQSKRAKRRLGTQISGLMPVAVGRVGCFVAAG